MAIWRRKKWLDRFRSVQEPVRIEKIGKNEKC